MSDADEVRILLPGAAGVRPLAALEPGRWPGRERAHAIMRVVTVSAVRAARIDAPPGPVHVVVEIASPADVEMADIDVLDAILDGVRQALGVHEVSGEVVVSSGAWEYSIILQQS